MPELLLELFSEEIPARMQRQAAEQLKQTVMDRLSKEGLLVEAVRTFVTPRRLTCVVDGLPAVQPDICEERKGPRTDAPEKAIEGFLKSTGLTLDQCQTKEDKKGSFYVAIIEKKGQSTADFLKTFVPELVRGFSWPKSMRWGAGEMRWVRPLHAIVCIFDGEVVPCEVDGIASGNTTWGHRFLGPDPLNVSSFEDYCDKLQSAHVVLDLEQRRRIIAEDAKTLTFAEGFELIDDNDLLEENAGLTEWPVTMVGSIDDGFVKGVEQGGLPPEVLTSAMKKHQKYFSVNDPKTGGLAARFVMVSNLVAKDGGKQIVAGNERVLRARLSDAKFFWDQDRKHSLESRVEKLNDIVFHAKLGSVYDKVQRIAALAQYLAPLVSADPAQCARAAKLAKADLTTGMVGEFADLQGLMGRYYARHDGEPAEVANAVYEHYAPLGPSDVCPSSPVSVTVALADKLDTLVGFWAIDEKPTGSKDPYALRRAALGVIRLLLENDIRLNLIDMMTKALAINNRRRFPDDTIEWGGRKVDKVPVELFHFFADRLKVYLRDRGIAHTVIDAVFALEGEQDLVLMVNRMRALNAFLETDDGTNLLTAYARATNILQIEEKKDKADYAGAPDPALFTETVERELHNLMAKAVGDAATHIENENFESAMGTLAGLREPVDRFFDTVKVNDDDPKVRKNRLLMLSQIRSVLSSVADFSKLDN